MTESGVTPGSTGRPMRADARRNYDRILAAAEVAIARHGAEASLEEIARQAGVGSATLHRHFPTRRALLEAVFHDRVEALCARARELAGDAEPGPALVVWLRAVGAYVAATRGLAASLIDGARDGGPPQSDACYAMIADAGGELLRRAREADAVRPGVSIDDLLAFVNAISLAAEHGPGGAAEADRLLALAIDGIRPHAHAIEATRPRRSWGSPSGSAVRPHRAQHPAPAARGPVLRQARLPRQHRAAEETARAPRDVPLRCVSKGTGGGGRPGTATGKRSTESPLNGISSNSCVGKRC